MDAGVNGGSSWQTSCGGVIARLGEVRARGLWTDCVILVGKERSPVDAHRLLLAAASPVLAAMLYGPSSNTDQPVSLPNIDTETFQLLLDYMYTDDITIKSFESACRIYKAANYLILPHVQEMCNTIIIDHITPRNVLSIYEFSELYGDKKIMDECLEVMSIATTLVLKAAVLDAQPETLRRLFSLPLLSIVSELDLFQAAERWVRARAFADTPALEPDFLLQSSADIGVRRKLENVGDTDEGAGVSRAKRIKLESNGIADLDVCKGNAEFGDGDTKSTTEKSEKPNQLKCAKMLIRDALKEIRFLTLSLEEFAANDMSTLLSQSDMLAISLNLIRTNSHMSMPEGFSSSRKLRNRNNIFIFSGPDMV